MKDPRGCKADILDPACYTPWPIFGAFPGPNERSPISIVVTWIRRRGRAIRILDACTEAEFGQRKRSNVSSRDSKSSRRSSSPDSKSESPNLGKSGTSRASSSRAGSSKGSSRKKERTDSGVTPLSPPEGSAAAAAVATAMQAEERPVSPTQSLDLGRCGGREIRSPLERRVCQALSQAGVAHSHAPRRFEVTIQGDRMAAYSPCIVLRGRGREGKTTVIECMGALDSTYAQKVESFHKAYEAEFYVILVASLAVLEDLPPTAYDEGILPSEIESLIGRIAD
jgi:hypothetical protein